MLEPKRVHRLVLELPRDHRVSTSVFGNDVGYEALGRRQKARLILGPNQRALSQRPFELVFWHVVLGIAEILDRAKGEDHHLSGSLSGRELPVELLGIEFTGARFDAIPVGPEAQQLEGIFEQRIKRGRPSKAESFHLARPKTDSEQRRIPWQYRNTPPVVVHRTLRLREPCTEHLLRPPRRNTRTATCLRQARWGEACRGLWQWSRAGFDMRTRPESSVSLRLR